MSPPSLLSALVVACSAPTVDVSVSPPDSRPPADTDREDTGPEQVPGEDTEEWSTPPLCHVSLDCSTTIPDEPKIPCELQVQAASGSVLYRGWAGVELRGRSSSAFPKHQYNIELWADEAGSETVAVNFWGMGGDSDWILNGNYADRALFRNKLAYDLFRDFGAVDGYAPETVLCDATIDGTWLGVYTWGERAKRDDDRIAISDRLDGQSFIVKNDDGGTGFMSAPDFYGEWLMVWPHQDEASDEALGAVRSRLGAMHTALEGADPEAVWSIVDIDSAVDWVILEELSRNNDAYFLSVYLWQDTDDLIHFVPWDLDLAFGGYPITSCGWDGWVGYRSTAITNFARSETFATRLVERWEALRNGVLADEQVLARMDRYVDVMGDALAANFDVWTYDEIEFCFSDQCWLCPSESWEAEQILIRDWTSQRMAWMDDAIGDFAEGP